MIIPSRWFAGGMGLDSFRNLMLNDERISKMVDFTNSKDCFPNASIGGGVNFFLWESDYSGLCNFTNIHNGESNTMLRKLDEYSVFVRYNEAVSILHKINNTSNLVGIVSSLNPFGLNSSERGVEKNSDNTYTLYSSKGKSYIEKQNVTQGLELINKYKVLCSKVTSEHAGEADKNGKFKVLSRIQVLKPGEVCTFSYFTLGSFDNEHEANNLYMYLKTKFARFLLLQAVSSINLSKEKFFFIPMQNFTSNNSIDWSKSILDIDTQLYKKYSLSVEEILFIDNMIKDM